MNRFAERGTHEGCGACCSRWLPLTPACRARLEAYVANGGALPERAQRTDDAFTCPFLDADGRCSIYDIRPEICRAFSCDDEAMQATFRFTGNGNEMQFLNHVGELTDICELVASCRNT